MPQLPIISIAAGSSLLLLACLLFFCLRRHAGHLKARRSAAGASAKATATTAVAARSARTSTDANEDDEAAAEERERLTELLEELEDPTQKETAVRALASLCRVDGPSQSFRADVYLPGAPAAMPPSAAVRSAIVLRGGLMPLLTLMDDRAAGGVSPEAAEAVGTSGRDESGRNDDSATVGPAMLTLCLLAMEEHLRADILAAGTLSILRQLLLYGLAAEQELAASIIGYLASGAREAAAFRPVVAPLVHLAVQGVDAQAADDAPANDAYAYASSSDSGANSLGQAAMKALGAMAEDLVLKAAIDVAVAVAVVSDRAAASASRCSL